MTKKRYVSILILALMSFVIKLQNAVASEEVVANSELEAKVQEIKDLEEALSNAKNELNKLTQDETSDKSQRVRDENTTSKPVTTKFSADDDSLVGDQLEFETEAFPFAMAGTPESQTSIFCAPVRSIARVSHEDLQGKVYMNFDESTDESIVECISDDDAISVQSGIQYTIERSDLEKFDYRRKGVVFGGLVVPFKYYLSGDKRVATSTTVAPYVGLRNAELWGLHITPVISGGLGLVPVNSTATDENGVTTTGSDTKAALSVAAGIRLTSDKNKAFSAGILFGKDFLSNADRSADPTVGKLWTSLYFGLAIK